MTTTSCISVHSITTTTTASGGGDAKSDPHPLSEKITNHKALACRVKVFRLACDSYFIGAIYCQGRFIHPVHKLPFLWHHSKPNPLSLFRSSPSFVREQMSLSLTQTISFVNIQPSSQYVQDNTTRHVICGNVQKCLHKNDKKTKRRWNFNSTQQPSSSSISGFRNGDLFSSGFYGDHFP